MTKTTSLDGRSKLLAEFEVLLPGIGFKRTRKGWFARRWGSGSGSVRMQTDAHRAEQILALNVWIGVSSDSLDRAWADLGPGFKAAPLVMHLGYLTPANSAEIIKLTYDAPDDVVSAAAREVSANVETYAMPWMERCADDLEFMLPWMLRTRVRISPAIAMLYVAVGRDDEARAVVSELVKKHAARPELMSEMTRNFIEAFAATF